MKLAALCLLATAVPMLTTCANGVPRPPQAERRPHELVTNGHTRIDDYYWLRERDNSEVLGYLEAENAYTDAMMADTAALQRELFEEIKGRIAQTDSSVPAPDHGYLYYDRTEDGRQYPIYCRIAEGEGAVEQVLLDVNEVAAGHEFCSVKGPWVNPATDVMVWGVDTVGRRKYTLRFTDLTTGAELADVIPEVAGSVAWFNDGSAVLYVRQDPETLRWYQVWRHVVGTDPDEDELVYEEDDDTFSVDVAVTESRRFIVVESSHTLATEVRVVDADDPRAEPRIIAPRQRGVEYHVTHHGDRFLILTNFEAENFRLMETPIEAAGREAWRELVPHRADVLLDEVTVFRDFIVLTERARGRKRLVVHRVEDGAESIIAFDGGAYDVWVDDNRVFDSGVLRIGYSSLATPTTIYDVDMATGEKTMRKRQEIGGGWDPDAYISERIMVPSLDGVEVPVSLLRRRDFDLDGRSPLLLYGYGSYGASIDPEFNPDVLSLLDRGFSYAIAHVRGGQEMGRRWYVDGKLLSKKHTFEDFIDCARYFVDNGYTSPELLLARGGSAGGLLMGAVANMAPELFAGIVAHVPFVDVVTTMLDESIPLTTSEFDEWGDPKDPVFYDYMLSYSPYDQVEAKAYPAMMVTAGLHDSQVQYWEPAKWVAKLRSLKTDDNLLVLRTRMDAGHGGASGRYDRYRERAEEYAFMLKVISRGD